MLYKIVHMGRHNLARHPPVEGVARRIRAIRLMLGLRPSDFAEFLGISKSALSNVERGGYPLSRDMAFQLVSKIDDLTLDYLYFGSYRGLTVEMAARLKSAEKQTNDND